jgi:DNA-binding NarL/FixJ family response regulator
VVQLEHGALEKLERARRLAPHLPILALLEETDAALINALQQRGAEVAVLPVHAPNLVSFAQRSLSASFLPHDRVARTVAQLAASQRLTAREVQILTYSLGNEPRARVRRRLGIGENTLKTQVRTLLRKCNERSVDALAKNVLRAALLMDRPELETVAPWAPAIRANVA